MSSVPPPINPFPGLRPFTQEEDYLFFGREEQTLELLQRLGSNRFVAVVGTSGSGKSSLVRCGLLSELLGGRMLGAGSSWEIAVTHPGGNPLALLTDSLLEADLYDREEEHARENLLATLSRSHFGLVAAVKQADLGEGTNFLLVVDQFEEIFRFQDAGQRQQEVANEFVSLLLEAVAQKEVPIYIVLTMRSDFIGECGQFEGLAEMVNRGEFLIPRLTREQYKRVIEGPIKVAGGQIAPRLLQRLLNDLGQQADQLPCLQHALMRTWDVWAGKGDSEALDLDDYQRVGRMAEAMSLHADEIYQSLASDRHRELCQGIFQALTVEESNSRGIRRPQRLGRLCQILEVPTEDLVPIIDAYRQSGVTFLMPSPEVELTEQTIIDISHESLMRVWTRLRQWVEEETQAAGIYHRLSESAALHELSKAGLYRDPELGIALAWRESKRPNAAWAERYRPGFATAMSFLEASQQASVAEEQARDAARQRELAQAQELAEVQQLRLEQQQRSARKLRKLIAGLAGVAVVAGIALVAALVANNQANKLRIVASQEAENARQSEDRAKKSADKAEQSAVEANRLGVAAQQAQFDALDQTYLATLNEIRSIRLARQSGWRSAALGRLQNLVQLGSRNVNLVELRTEAIACLAEMDVRLQSKLNSSFNAWHIQYSPDGQMLAVNNNETISVLDLATNREFRTITKSLGLAPFAYHPSGTLAVASTAGRLTYHPIKPEQPTFPEIVGDGHALNLAFSRSGDRVATVWGDVNPREGFPTTVRRAMVHDTATGAAIWDVEFPTNTPGGYKIALALSPDGQSLATVGPERQVRLFLVGKNEEPIVLGSLDTRICAIDFHPDGQSLVAAGRLSGAVFDLQSHSELYRIHAPEGGFWDVAFSPDGQLIAGVANDEVVRLWDSRTGREIAVVPAETGGHYLSLSFSTQGDRLAVGGGSATIFEIEGRRACRIDHSPTNYVAGLAFDPTQSALLASGGDRMIRSWKLNESVANSLRSINRRNSKPTVMRLAPDGRHLVHGFGRWENAPADDFSLSVWSLDNSQSERRLEGPQQPVLDIAFDPTGHRLAAAAQDGGIHVWDFETGLLENRLELDGVTVIQYLDETQLLAVAGNRLILVAASDGDVLGEVSLPGKAAAFVITPDRREALVGDFNGSIHRVRLSDMAIKKSSLVLDRPSNLLMALSPDSKLLAVSTSAGSRNLFIDPRSLEPLARLPGYDKRLSNIEFDHHGRYFAMGGAQIALWDLALVRRELMRLDLDFGELNADEVAALFTEANDHASSRSDKASIIATAARFQGVLEKLADQMADDGKFQAELARKFAEQGKTLLAEAARTKARLLFEQQLAKEPENSSIAADLSDVLLTDTTHWTVLKPSEMKSEGGATLTLQDDNSVLAGGKNTLGDVYSITTELDEPVRVTAIRLEALTNPSLPNNGPGRDENRHRGNFDMVGFQTTAWASGSDVLKVPLSRGTANTSSQVEFTVQHWNGAGAIGQAQTAWYELESPLEMETGSRLHFEMRFSATSEWPLQNLGRFRLSVNADPTAFDRERMRLSAMKLTNPWAKLAAAYDIVGDQSAVSRLLEQHPEMAIHFADIAADAKDWDSAITLYNRLITPDTTDADLLGKRAAAYIATERWELAKADWLRVIELKPQLALTAFDQLTAAQRWNEASQLGLMALAQNPTNSILWLRIAAAGAISGDRVGYEAICKWIAEQPLETTELAERAIKCCLLRPGAIDINKLPGNVLAKGLSDGTVPESVVFWYWSSRALLAYRSGDAESALSFANMSESFHPEDFDHALNLSILALAHHQLMQSEEAQNAYAEGIRIIQRLKEDPNNRISHDVLIPELLLGEAEAMINGTTEPKQRDDATTPQP